MVMPRSQLAADRIYLYVPPLLQFANPSLSLSVLRLLLLVAVGAIMAVTAATASRTGPSADSYIGSLISLTSKSEIRYEGVLYNINTEESSIGLRNVRSFGTEGRKKDGQQIHPSDKIYEYILFRGSDIKDLQVKSSPPVQTAPPMHNDPAIIQSHYSRPVAPASVSASLPSVGSGTVTDLSSHSTQGPRSTFQSGLPLYQPGGSLGSWGSAPPTANVSGLAMPMYWQGFYAPSGNMPHLQQPPLLRPPSLPPGLPIPHSMQQPFQYPVMNPSLQSGSQNLLASNALLQSGSANFPGLNTLSQSAPTNLPGISMSSGLSNLSGIGPSLPSTSSNLPGISALMSSTGLPGSNMLLPSGSPNLPEFPPALLPHVSGSLTSATLPSSTQATSSAVDILLSPLPNNPSVTSLPSTTLSDNWPFMSSLSSSLESTVTPACSKLKSPSCTESAYQLMPEPISSATGSSCSRLSETSMPSLLTPGRLWQPGSSSLSSSQSLQMDNKATATELKSASSEPQKQASIETKDALLPLPRPSDEKQNEAPWQTNHTNRGRGRGRGNTFSHSEMNFTEDFDFTAMNDKFNKDELWGHLGKSRGHLRDQEGSAGDNNNGGDDDDHHILDEGNEEYSKFGNKPAYVKDNFFDSLSCNALYGGARNGRTKFSEQLKIDTETSGDFPRHRPGRGRGRGFGDGGWMRGSFYGRGYG